MKYKLTLWCTIALGSVLTVLTAFAVLTELRRRDAAEAGTLAGLRGQQVVTGLLEKVAAAQSARRGYVLQRDRSMLQPISPAVRDARAAIAELKSLEPAGSPRRTAVHMLEKEIDALIGKLERSTAIMPEDPAFQSAQAAITREGEAAMSRVRTMGADLRVQYQQLAEFRAAEEADIDARATHMLGAGVLGVTAFMAVAIVLLFLELRRRRHSLEASNSRFKAIIAHTPSPIFVKDRDGQFLAANPSFLRAIGRTAEEVIGRIDRFVFAETGGAMCESRVQHFASGSGAQGQEEFLSGPHGTTYLCAKFPLPGVNGDSGLICGIGTDITGRLRTEQAIHDERQRYEELVDSLDGVIWEADARTLQFHFVSQGAERLLGYSRAAWLQPDFWNSRIHPEDREATVSECRAAVLQGVNHQLEYRMIDAGGRAVWIRDIVTLVPANSHPARLRGMMVDVSEKRASRDQLVETNELLQAVVQGTSDAVFVKDREGRYLLLNRAGAAMLGISPEDAVGKTDFDLFPRADAERLRGYDVATMASDGPQINEEYPLSFPDRQRIFQSSRAPYRNAAGEVIGLLGVSRDVSEQKQGEQQLRLLRAALEAAANSVVITDTCGAIQWVNPAFSQLTGYSREEVIGQNPRILRSGEQGTEIYADLWHTILRGDTWKGELVNRRKDGTLYTEHITITPVRGHTGEITNFVAIKEDFSQQRRMEEELRRSEAELRSLVEHSPFGIYRSSREGKKFLSANPAIVQMLGYASEEEILNLNVDSLYFEVQERDHLIAQAEVQGLRNTQVHWRRKDGSTIVVRLNGRLVSEAFGDVFEVIAEDVTGYVALEEQFRQAQKLEAVGRLAGGVAHDFNNMLGVIMGHSELLAEKLTLGQSVEQNLASIQKAAHKAADLTRQLLAFSRKQVMNPTVLNLNGVVEDLAKLLHRVIGEDIQLTMELQKPLDNILADRTQMEQVIMNLVVNARDAMPKGGRVALTTRVQDLDESYSRLHSPLTPGRYVMLAIADTGCGMDAATKARIFEPFFTTKEQGKGTGLGLATVYGIVKQSGGFIWVYSEPGMGTTFKIYLPVSGKAKASLKPEAQQPARSSHGQTVVLVEDEPSLRETATQFLQAFGYRVIACESGQDALRQCESLERHIDLLITDVIMPGLSGPDLAQQLKSKRPEMKVLFVSGYTDDSLQAHDLIQPGTAFLEKPFTSKMLIQAAEKLLGRKP